MAFPLSKAKREARIAPMPASDFVVVILGAGKGTRLRSGLAKVLHRAGGPTLIEQVVRACRPLGARELIAVAGHQADDVDRKSTRLNSSHVRTSHADFCLYN